ncbi:ABC transporter permease subunit [Arthrobacter castelli]|uniref:ABC transporter permease subunit n=1 Tax=Arthrobacter castelli TaxID=271431 RepID=UPI000427F31F|nr:ABC transporter permease subunit [Arthrobacter castelli]
MSTANREAPGTGAAPLGRQVPAAAKLVHFIGHQLQLQVRAVIGWSLALGLYTAAMVAIFPSFSDLENLTAAIPEGMREGLGITDIGTIEGFLSAEAFSIVTPLALAFFPMLSLSAVIAGAEERGTIDVLFSNPLPRWLVVVGSFLAVAISLLAVVVIIGLLMWSTALLVGVDLDFSDAAAAVLNLWPLCMFFGSLALLCSAIFHRRLFGIAIPGVLLLGMYLLDVIGNLSEDLEDARVLSVFHHYGSAIEEGIDGSGFAGITCFAVLFVILAVAAFHRRDIYT